MEDQIRKKILTNDIMRTCYNVAVEYISLSMNFKKPDDIDPEFKILTKRCLCCRGINSSETKPFEEAIHAKSLNHIAHKHGIPQLMLLIRVFVDRIHAVFEDNENPSPDQIPSYSSVLKDVERRMDHKFIIKLDRSIRQFLSVDYNGINDIDPNILSDEHLIDCLYYLYAMDRTYGNPVYYNRFLISDVSSARLKRLKAIHREIVEDIEALMTPVDEDVFGFLDQVASNDVDRYVIA